MPKVSLGELADRLEAELTGEREREVSGLRSLAEAGPEELSFLHQAAYKGDAEKSGAGALIVPQSLRELAAAWGRPLLVVAHSQLAVARALALFHPRPAAARRHPSHRGGGGGRRARRRRQHRSLRGDRRRAA